MKKRIISLLMCGILTIATPVMAVAEADVPMLEEMAAESIVTPEVNPEVTVTPEVSPEINVEPEVTDESEVTSEPEVMPEVTIMPERDLSRSARDAGDVVINASNFPDEKFREAVKTQFDKNKDGKFDTNEINNARKFVFVGEADPDDTDTLMKNIKGIEYFVKLEELNIQSALLGHIDLSNNTQLKSVRCKGTYTSTIDLSKNIELLKLDCTENYIKNLDLSENVKLTSLICPRNDLRNLDLSNTINLEELDCGYYEPYLENLPINLFDTVDLSKNVKLKKLKIDRVGLKSLDLSNNGDLQELNCTGNWELTPIDFSQVTKLENLLINECNLTSLDLSSNNQLKSLSASENQLTQITLNNTKLALLSIAKNKLASLDLRNCPNLETVLCWGNELTSINVSNNVKLISLAVSENKLTSLDLRNCPDLADLYCEDNKLMKLDVSKCTKLESFQCAYNQLKSIDISKNTKLESFGFSNNELKSIDISKNTKLVNLACANNKITTIKGLEKRKSLKSLLIKNNKFKTIPNLKDFKELGNRKYGNPSVTLDLSGNYISASALKSKLPTQCLKETKWLKQQIDSQKIRKQTGVKLAGNSANSIKITWKKTADAQGYRIYRATSANGTYKGIKNVKTLSTIDQKLKAGATYYYKVRAYKKVGGKTIFGSYSDIVSKKAELDKPKVTLKAKSKSAIDLSWKKVSGATKYQIYRSTSAKGTYKRIATVSGLKFGDTKLAKNKTYFYKVRAVQTISGKAYTTTSSVFSAKTKK